MSSRWSLTYKEWKDVHPQLQATQSLVCYENVERAMNDVVESAFYRGPFFQHLLAGRYSHRQIRHFAIQYSYYSRHFPRVLGAAISAMEPQDSWWIPLADNLWDEAGRGRPGKSHQQLYRTFLQSVDPHVPTDTRGYPVEPESPAVSQAVQTFLQFFQSATPLEAMAAVGLGSELFAGAVMGTIGTGLRHPAYQTHGPINVLFWEVHADEHEPRHYQLCKDILQTYSNPESLARMFAVGKAIAESEALMYTQLHQEMVSLDATAP